MEVFRSLYIKDDPDDAVLGVFILIQTDKPNEKDTEEGRQYAGPVPEGYDQEHYWKTGETIPLEEGVD